LVEHTLGKGEVTGSIPVVSSAVEKCFFRDEIMPRDKIILACGECKNRNYFTTKNKRLHPERVEWKKYCPRCNKHQTHKETK
jgi:large subunit ribosomal protein L33